MRNTLFAASVISAIAIALIPAVWWIEDSLMLSDIFPTARKDWAACLPHYIWATDYAVACKNTAYNNGWLEGLRLSSLAFYFLMISTVTFLALAIDEPGPSQRIIRGRKLYIGKVAKKKLHKALKRIKGSRSIKLFGTAIPDKLHRRHWLLQGSVGGGKTVFIWSYLHALVVQAKASDQSARNVVLDVKGDFVEYLQLPDITGKIAPPAILNPFDKRSLEWWIGEDVTTLADAKEFTKKFLSKSASSDFWPKATSNIVIAVIRSLQVERGTNWSWYDLSKQLASPVEKLAEWAAKYYWPASKVFAKVDNETSTSILINVATDFAAISDIASYWHRDKQRPKFSLSRWLDWKDRYPNLIVGWDASADTTCVAWTSAFIDIIGKRIASPRFKSCPGINLILDEFNAPASVGGMNGILAAIDIGRSKGVSVLLGLQSITQLRSVFGHRANGLASIMGNMVFCQMAPGQDSQEASKFLGEQTIRERQTTHSKSGSTTSWSEKQSPLVSPDEFSSKLGPDDDGITLLYAPIGADAYQLHVPYPKLRKIRPVFVPAKAIDTFSSTPIRSAKKANPFKQLVSTK